MSDIEMPHSDQTERAALTALAMGCGDVRDLLPEMFYVPANRTAFEVVARCAAEGSSYCDICLEVAERYEGKYSEPRIKALDVLSAAYCADGWGFYVDTLKQLAARRVVMRTAAAIMGWASDGSCMDVEGVSSLIGLFQQCGRAVGLAAATGTQTAGREDDVIECAVKPLALAMGI